ncbi:MAG: hypothetical protein MK183_11775, partial [Verrucomicrobiales bacterium]|nr:hypothetical protein [Verrucomicrobiales bacterium]
GIVTLSDPLTGNRLSFPPEDGDSDNDGLPDSVETNTGIFVSGNNTGTDPLNPDTDGDGWMDGNEIELGSSPLNPHSTPPFTLDANATRRPDGSIGEIILSFPALSGQSYSIEGSPDLESWQVLEQGIAGEGAPITRSYLGQTGLRFFRLRRE